MFIFCHFQSPGSGESGPESPQHHDKTDDSGRRTNDDDAPNTDRSGGSSTENGGSGGGGGDMKPSIGIRSDLLPLNPRDLMDAAGGLPALEALRRQAAAGGAQNPFLAHNSPLGGLSLTTTKRPSQPPTPQSSTSGGDPASAWSFEEQFKQVHKKNLHILTLIVFSNLNNLKIKHTLCMYVHNVHIKLK